VQSSAQPETIFTDSLCSLYQIRAAILRPHSLTFSKHKDLLANIVALLRTRSTSGLATNLVKVPGHAGVHGNDVADFWARMAVADRAACKWVDPSNNQPRSSYYWAADRAATTDGTSGEAPIFYVNDLISDVKRRIGSQTETGYAKHGTYVTAWRDAWSVLDLPRSTSIMKGTGGNHSVAMSVFRAWWGLVWNNKLAARFKRQTDATCPLCTQLDSTSHILWGCMHPDMKASYILRHDDAVKAICGGIRHGAYGGCFCLMDAGKSADLPSEVSGKRLPSWMLPQLTDEERNSMRPDILLVPSLTHVETVQGKTPRTTTDRQSHTVYLVEVGYGSDLGHDRKQVEKRLQHATLQSHLEDAGWTVEYTVLSLGHAGTLHKDFLKSLTNLGLSKTDASDTCAALHKHACRTCHTIVKLRRTLERASAPSSNRTRPRLRPTRREPP
jgi:hypothetical protein